MPGIVLAIIMKHKKSDMKFKLYEKSFHKSNFLKEVTKKFNLNVEVLQKDVFNEKTYDRIYYCESLQTSTIILNLIHNNFKFFKEVILFYRKKWKTNFG